MKSTLLLLACLVIATAAAGCAPSKKSYTLEERREIIDNMADQELQRLFIEKPLARQEIADAAGYGVFSNANVNVIFVSGGGGYGVVVDNKTGRKTYMNMALGGVGVGIGAKDYRQILIFNSSVVLKEFIGSGWDFGGQADATAKTGETGGAIGGEDSVSKSIKIYTVTETGLALQASLTGTRYWIDEELNRPGL